MSAEWIQQQKDELRNIVDAVHIQLDAVAHDSHWWCPRCHSQIKNRAESITKHLFICKLQDIVPHPRQVPPEVPVHQFYYAHCPAVVSLLQPPQHVQRDYLAELQRTVPAPRTVPVPQWSDMVVAEHTTAPQPASSDASPLQVREYAVSTQGRGAELMTHTAPLTTALSAEQLAHHRVNQRCAALWQEQQSLAARSQFYEAVEWTARAEREQSGVASVDAQVLEEWLASTHAQQAQAQQSRHESEREQRSRPEKYRAKNLLTKKRPADLQRDMVQLLFAQISVRTREPDRGYQDRDHHREHDRDNARGRDRDRDNERDRDRERGDERHYHARESEHRRDRDRDMNSARERKDERRDERKDERSSREDSHERKRRRESSEEHAHKRQRHQ